MTLRTPTQLAASGLVEQSTLPQLERVAERYAVAVTPYLAKLIDPDDACDPIAAQYVPSGLELDVRENERADPIGDSIRSPVPGIVHRYEDRVLLKVIHACASYCRFCFRREMIGPGKEPPLTGDRFEKAIDYIQAHQRIWEVVLTGGDPLVLPPAKLRAIIDRLATIPHVRVVRVHTRLPVIDPQRIDALLIAAMIRSKPTMWISLHANHPRELTPAARAACARIIDAGIPMLSQSVLLKGINDDPAILEELLRIFVECRIKPYRLNHADLASGTSHFRTSIARGQALMGALRGRISGLCQPEYVLDIPGGYGKSPIGPSYVAEASGGPTLVRDYREQVHEYDDGV